MVFYKKIIKIDKTLFYLYNTYKICIKIADEMLFYKTFFKKKPRRS